LGAASLFLFLLFDPDDRKNLSDIIARKYSRSLSDLHTHREREKEREKERRRIGKSERKNEKTTWPLATTSTTPTSFFPF